MRQNTKEVVMNEQRYQIARMDARTGSWIAMQILTKLFPFNMESMMGLDASKLPANRTDLTEREFQNIQNHCLKMVSRIDPVGDANTAPIPILMATGAWSFKELETDVVTVLALTAQSLVFNIGPFFEEGALKPLLESLSGLSQFSAPNIDLFLFRPVLAGWWKQKETWDGTYTLEDLVEAHELLDYHEETDARVRDTVRR